MTPQEKNRRETLRKYGLRQSDYDRMMVRQHGVCAACGEPETAAMNGQPMSLAVDHDHDSGAFRGLLCGRCNRALGLSRDNPETLRRLADYVEYFNWEKSIAV